MSAPLISCSDRTPAASIVSLPCVPRGRRKYQMLVKVATVTCAICAILMPTASAGASVTPAHYARAATQVLVMRKATIGLAGGLGSCMEAVAFKDGGNRTCFVKPANAWLAKLPVAARGIQPMLKDHPSLACANAIDSYITQLGKLEQGVMKLGTASGAGKLTANYLPGWNAIAREKATATGRAMLTICVPGG